MKQNGISPVIGVILLVAVTVALVGLSTFIVLNMSDGKSKSQVPDSSIKATQTSNGLQTTVLKDSNVREFVIQGPDGKNVTLDSDTGSVETIADGSGQYEVIAITNDGSDQVVKTTDIEEGSEAANARTASFTQSGTVTVNPDVSGAIVKSVEDGITIDVTQTDSNGEFSVGASKDSNITVIVKGFTDPALAGPLYASATKQSKKGSPLTFDFEESSSELVRINGEDKLISYNPDSTEKEVGTSEQLQAIDKIDNGLSSDYEIVDSINFSNSSTINEFNPIGSSSSPFTGTIDGNGNTIKNMNISNSSEEKVAWIKYSENSNIKNITFIDPELNGDNNSAVLIGDSSSDTIENIQIKNGQVDGKQNIGGLIAITNSSTVIRNVSSDVEVNTSTYGSGSLVGYNEGTIEDSKSSGSSNGTYDIGGLVGYNEGTIENSESSATVNGTGDVGGLVGENALEDSKIINSYATGSVTISGDYAGGLAGSNYGIVKNSYATGDVNGKESVAGLISYNAESASNIKNSYATGDVNGTDYVGGLLGTNRDSKVINSYASGNITGENFVGGLIQYNFGNSPVINSHYNGTIYNITSDAAGLIQYNSGVSGGNTSIYNSYFKGNISVSNRSSGPFSDGTAGLVEYNNASNNGKSIISNSYVEANMETKDGAYIQVDGLIYNNNATNNGNASIYSSYYSGNITADKGASGLIGSNFGSTDGQAVIKNTYADGKIVSKEFDSSGLISYTSALEDGNASVYNSSFKGNVTSKSGVATGLVRYFDVGNGDIDVYNSSVKGNMSSNSTDVSGLINYIGIYGAGGDVNIRNNSVKANLSSSLNDTFSGPRGAGLIGFIDMSEGHLEIENSSFNGSIKASTKAGGLVGIYNVYDNGKSNLSNSHSNADITVNATGGGKIGGLISVVNQFDQSEYYISINNSYTVGKYDSKDRVSTDDSCIGCDTNLYIGGLIGESYSDDGRLYVNNSYSRSELNGGGDEIGGIIGRNVADISKTYYVGEIQSDTGSDVGGLVGNNTGTGIVSDSYWNESTISNAVGNTEDTATKEGEIKELETSEMQGSSAETNMDTFDFNNNWTTVTGDYPKLQD